MDRILIHHSFMDNIGGAEKLSLILAKELSRVINTTVKNDVNITKLGFNPLYVVDRYHILDFPENAPFRHMTTFSYFNSKINAHYDVNIITGDWAISVANKNKHTIWYAHSALRELYDMYEYIRNSIVPLHLRFIYDIWVKIYRKKVENAIKKVDYIVCNSKVTRDRIKKYFNRDAEIIYPPVDTAKYYYKDNGDFWLSVNRLISHKRIDMQIEAFRQMPHEKLVIVGCYEKSKHFTEYKNKMLKNLPNNVEILHWVSDNKLLDLYANCKGVISTAINEDFGMTAIEAMASGKIIIAPAEGGYKESVINNKTGFLLKNITTDKLIKEINKKRDYSCYKEECIDRAKDFDVSVFINKMKGVIDKCKKKVS